MILDEATSALDYNTERKVCENLRRSTTGTTVFFITHRLSTIKNADKIVMMESGSIAEVGSHDELMAKKEDIMLYTDNRDQTKWYVKQ